MLLLLFFAAFVAGFIDSIAGSGGMIAIPALLLAGISPLQALATNKLQGSFGSFWATLQFYKKGYINIKSKIPFAATAFCFSAIGTTAVQFLQADFLSKILPFLILIFGLYFLFSPSIKEAKQTKKFNPVYLVSQSPLLVFMMDFLDLDRIIFYACFDCDWWFWSYAKLG
ncbi:TSUP family transporter [uncultured Helicobacter sp.]|uniref:TSUP family transporter n=1 Tax=uncultured Helicobacter sp. TaxID=175537 RepID=UPI00374ED39D